MILVSEIWDEAKLIFGHTKADRLLKQITDTVELLATSGDIDPLVGTVDICAQGNCITLPREVETVLGLNICGRPALPRDSVFYFHVNGPGAFDHSASSHYADAGNWPTYRDLKCPAKLIAFLDNPEDAGKEMRVFGYDDQNRPLRTKEGDTWRDGLLVPTIYGYAVPDSNAQTVGRITGIFKARTVADVRLSSFDSSTSTGTLLGVYEPDETKPIYRRIKVRPCGPWIRVLYRKRTYELYSVNDRILIHSRPAFILAMRANKFYFDGDLPNGNAYEANAVRLLNQKEWTLGSPAGSPIQVRDISSVLAKDDYVD